MQKLRWGVLSTARIGTAKVIPAHLHVPWSIRALEAGKHVLCEKPIGLSSAEGQMLVDAAERHPQLKRR
jgi:predicted dehydrogenase